MDIVAEYGRDDLAKVYVARLRSSPAGMIEFVESLQPPRPRAEKWVVIVSSLFGCPMTCLMCDAGGGYAGPLTAEEIIGQVRFLADLRFPGGRVETKMLKVQFARIGEPTFNPAVLEALERLPEAFGGTPLHAALSTIAPDHPAAAAFLDELVRVKDRRYPGGRFQMQFSIHTTDGALRDRLMSARKWGLPRIAEYGLKFSRPEEGDKKVGLNFAGVRGYPIDASVIAGHFDPDRFLIKLTPLNPTLRSMDNSLESLIAPGDGLASRRLRDEFQAAGFEVILNVGEPEENLIGSNCGQHIQRALGRSGIPASSYQPERYAIPPEGGGLRRPPKRGPEDRPAAGSSRDRVR